MRHCTSIATLLLALFAGCARPADPPSEYPAIAAPAPAETIAPADPGVSPAAEPAPGSPAAPVTPDAGTP